MRWFWAVVFLALTASACRAQEPAGKCSPAYQNNNDIDYGPLVGWHRKLVVHMSVGHIDACSVGDYK